MCCSCAHCTPGAVFRAAQCSGIRGAAFVLQSRGSSPSSRTGDGICVGGARSLRMMRKALFEMVTPWGKGIEKMDLWVEQEWDGTLSSVINGSINKAWSRGTLQIYGFLSPPADAIMADRTECLSRGNWAGIMKKGKKKKKPSRVWCPFLSTGQNWLIGLNRAGTAQRSCAPRSCYL